VAYLGGALRYIVAASEIAARARQRRRGICVVPPPA
jgi:hypothetical protein